MTSTQLQVFAAASALYHQAGWSAVLPVPPETKSPPPTGFTGAEGRDTPAELLASWASNGYAGHSIALRMPDGVIGIDVDHYVTPSGKIKVGGDTLAAAIERWGPLPTTWVSTARGEGPSGIAFFTAPSGRYATVIRPDIEIIQRHHRYAVVWPSPHKDLDTIYTWYGPDGRPATRLPSPTEFPPLPQAWVDGLREGASAAAPASASHDSGEALLAILSDDTRPACSDMYDALDIAVRMLSDAEAGARHDAMTARVHRIVQTAAMGHTGFGAALPTLRRFWDELTAGEDRSDEFERMLLSSARKAVTVLGGVRALVDPCTLPGGSAWAGLQSVTHVDARPRPADDRDPEPGEEFEPLHLELPPKLVDPSWTQVIGTAPFDPNVDLDYPLADEMLRRGYYMTRRAADTKSAWLLRGAEQWSLEGDLSGRLVAECTALMPAGDPAPIEKGIPPTPEQRQFVRRKRMMTNAGAAAVAAMVKRQTDGGRHPATVALAGLDCEPTVLWAGGHPWDLRASLDGPTVSTDVDPHGPHLMAAGTTPALMPTPRWDAFLSAVWPDPDVRAWALRVLSISLTGYADAALPVLFGEGGTGKTSLITLLMEVLGSYAHAANPKLLSDRSDQFMLYQLKGRRLSFIDEAMREGHRNAETLKQLTGGGQLSGAAKYQNEITFSATHTLVLTSNTPPAVADPAVRRRVRLIPCNGDAEEVRARRQELSALHWAAESPGVLALMMREAAAWLADPNSALTNRAPLPVQFALGQLVEEQDVLTLWLAEAVERNPHGTQASKLYAGFRGWCRDLGIKDSAVPNLTVWGTELTKRGYAKIERRDANYRPLIPRSDPGYTLNPSPSTPPVAADPPPPPGSLVNASDVEGPWAGGGGSQPQPSTPRFPSSSPLFSSSVEGVDSRSITINIGEKKENIYSKRVRETLAESPYPSTVDHGVGVSPQVGGPVEGADTPRIPPSEPKTAEVTAKNAPDLHKRPDDVVQPDSSPSVANPEGLFPAPEPKPWKITNADVAARAYQGEPTKQITKAEARKQLQAEQREAAIAAAAGEVLELPAVVDRAQNVLPVTPEQAAAVVRSGLAQSGALTVDVETSGYPVGHQHYELRSVQLGSSAAAAVFHPVDHAGLIRELLTEAPRLHAHSASADLVPLTHAGLIDAEAGWAKMHDTVIPAKLSDPQSTGSDPGLKQLSEAVLGPTSVAPAADAGRDALWKAARWQTGKQRFVNQLTTPLERNGWAQVQTGCTTMLRYAASDVLDTAALAQVLPPVPEAILNRERLAEAMTARVAHRGLRIDAARLRKLTAEHTRLQAEAGVWVRAFGIENPGSGPQIAGALQRLGETLPVSEKGNASVAEHVLSVIKRSRPDTPAGQLATAVLDYRHSTTVLGLFLAPYTALCERADARMRPTVYTLGTDTGRMSAVRPNVQQLPREGGVRSVVTADPGHVLISADFSGVELRGAAALSQDPTMLQSIAEEDAFNWEIAQRALRDCVSEKEARARILAERGWENAGIADGYHWVVARQAFGATATKADRYVAKRGVFGTFYGGGAEGLAKQVGVPVSEMETIRNSLRDTSPGYFAWVDQLKQTVRRGYTKFPAYSGRIIHLPADTPHKAVAYAISGSCRELLVDALVRWRDTRWGDCTLIPVHDELIGMVPEEDAQEATAELVRCMQGELYGVQIVAEPSEPSFAWQDST